MNPARRLAIFERLRSLNPQAVMSFTTGNCARSGVTTNRYTGGTANSWRGNPVQNRLRWAVQGAAGLVEAYSFFYRIFLLDVL